MSWGWKIALGYTGFVIFILYMVYRAVGVDFELVAPDYYSLEIAFQDQINKRENAVRAGYDVEIFAESDGVALQFKDFKIQDNWSGTVTFFRPSDSTLDRTFEWKMNERGMMFLDKKHFERGHYTFKADWTEGDKTFYIEKPIFIP
jgi:hypothetical protein